MTEPRTAELLAPWMSAPNVVAVMDALGAPETDARFVGGCVRDTLLGRAVTDIDIATPDRPEIVIEKLEAAGLQAVPTGLSHGTITAVSDHQGFEVTTLRKDTSSDGRYAEVEFATDWTEDASRRDFTFNALSLRPNGKVFDPFDGENDARNGVVRFIGEPLDRIKEDYLRILRYFRFVAHYGQGAPSESVVEVCRDLKGGLTRLSAERIRDELVKLLTAPNPSLALKAMARAEVLSRIIPDARDPEPIVDLVDVEQNANIAIDGKTWRRRLAFLLFVSNQDSGDVADRLKISKKDSAELQSLCKAASGATGAIKDPGRNRFLYAYGGTAARDAVIIARAQDRQANQSGWDDLYRAVQTWRPVKFPLSGKDVQDIGLAEGPLIGKVLNQLEQQWVDSGFTLSAEELRARVPEQIKLLGHEP